MLKNTIKLKFTKFSPNAKYTAKTTANAAVVQLSGLINQKQFEN